MGDAEDFYLNEAERYLEEGYQKHMNGDLSEAIVLYSKSLEFYPSAEAHTFLGWAFSMKGNYDQAIQECRRAIEVDPDFGNAYNDIGAYMIEQERFEEAVPWLEKATQAKRYESYCYPYYNLGRISEQKKDWTKALRYYQDAVKANSDYGLARKAVNRILSMWN